MVTAEVPRQALNHHNYNIGRCFLQVEKAAKDICFGILMHQWIIT